MLNKKFAVIIPLLCLSASGAALASENMLTACTSGDSTRLIEVIYPGETSVPCEVQYSKDNGPAKVLWSASSTEGYCEAKAREFVEKQKEWGWDCSTSVLKTQ